MNKRSLFFLVFGLVFFLVFLDQWSKIYVKLNFFLYESFPVLGDWFKIYFVENSGMAFGLKFGGDAGKLILTIIRLLAIVFGFFLIKNLIQKNNYPLGMYVFMAFVYAGAIGNTIDSLLYGVIFSESTGSNLSTLFPDGGGYGTALFGDVVDMIYFPLIETTFPEWVPIWGGTEFYFFSYIFNIADACVNIGFWGILIFYYKKIPNLNLKLKKTEQNFLKD